MGCAINWRAHIANQELHALQLVLKSLEARFIKPVVSPAICVAVLCRWDLFAFTNQATFIHALQRVVERAWRKENLILSSTSDILNKPQAVLIGKQEREEYLELYGCYLREIALVCIDCHEA